jgi:hypothetical protein
MGVQQYRPQSDLILQPCDVSSAAQVVRSGFGGPL